MVDNGGIYGTQYMVIYMVDIMVVILIICIMLDNGWWFGTFFIFPNS